MNILCHDVIDFEQIYQKFGVDKSHFVAELNELNKMADDGLLSIADDLEEIQKEIIVNDIKYNITINDNFGSKNRKRISIMNIPFQKCEFSENEMKGCSIQICELINKGFKRIIGIYNIKMEFKEIEISNDYFDKYYESFGDIYDIIKSNNSRYYNNIEEKLETKLIKYKHIMNENKINILNTNNFYESIKRCFIKCR